MTEPHLTADLLADRIGTSVLIRTVTNYWTGRVCQVDGRFVELDEAAWIADTGRFSAAIASGSLSEVEPVDGPVLVAVGAIVDVVGWRHDLPRSVR